MMSKADKLEKAGDKMISVGHQITAFVWTCFFLLIIGYIIWQVAF